MKKLSALFTTLMISGAANALELVHPENSALDDIEITLDCHSYDSGGWIAIYAEDAKLSQYGSSQKDWFYLNQGGDDCEFAFAPRQEPGNYVIRLFETSSYDEADEELLITIDEGPGRARPEAQADAEIDNENFWISAAASQLVADTNFRIGINCHEPGAVYTGRDMLIQVVEAGTEPGGSATGKFYKDWFYLKNVSDGNPCYYEFAGKPAGNYEVQVFQLDQPEVRVRMPITFAATQSGEPMKMEFDINKIEQPVNVWDPVRGKNNCIKMVNSNTVMNRCRSDVSVTMLKLTGGTGYEPRDAMTISAKQQQQMDFDAELSVGWFACTLDDEECMAAQACLADLKANWQAPYNTEFESRCNLSGHYMPL